MLGMSRNFKPQRPDPAVVYCRYHGRSGAVEKLHTNFKHPYIRGQLFDQAQGLLPTVYIQG